MEITPKTEELRPVKSQLTHDELAIIESIEPSKQEFVMMRLEQKFENYSQKEQQIISLNVITLAYRYLNQDSGVLWKFRLPTYTHAYLLRKTES